MSSINFAGTDEHCTAPFETVEDLAGELDGGRADGQATAADVGVGPRLLANLQGALEQFVDEHTRRSAPLGDFQGATHLTQDLRFADDEGIDAAGDAKQMPPLLRSRSFRRGETATCGYRCFLTSSEIS